MIFYTTRIKVNENHKLTFTNVVPLMVLYDLEKCHGLPNPMPEDPKDENTMTAFLISPPLDQF